jgi:hypothetical protein
MDRNMITTRRSKIQDLQGCAEKLKIKNKDRTRVETRKFENWAEMKDGNQEKS